MMSHKFYTVIIKYIIHSTFLTNSFSYTSRTKLSCNNNLF